MPSSQWVATGRYIVDPYGLLYISTIDSPKAWLTIRIWNLSKVILFNLLAIVPMLVNQLGERLTRVRLMFWECVTNLLSQVMELVRASRTLLIDLSLSLRRSLPNCQEIGERCSRPHSASLLQDVPCGALMIRSICIPPESVSRSVYTTWRS